MKTPPLLVTASLLAFASLHVLCAEPDFPLTADSLPHDGIPHGTLIKDNYYAKEGSVFPGTEREYQIYLPAGLDASKPAPFMVFQDGVIYQAPVVFDNLIAKKQIPPLIGIFIKPGVVPAANDNALPRFNRSYEYDSVTDTYSRFLIDEFLPAIAAKHKLNLSADPNARGIAGSSSGGICAFMVAWHRPDSFRRVFTSVGTYVGIHGADQLPVLVRKYEPKPIRIYLQSGENDNDLYCGDWWMANQMMERSLTWNGYDVNHTWGIGSHDQKHATAIFPDVLRWLWRDWQTNIEIKANPKGESKWKGYEVVGDGSGWKEFKTDVQPVIWKHLAPNSKGDVVAYGDSVSDRTRNFVSLDANGKAQKLMLPVEEPMALAWTRDNTMVVLALSGNRSEGEMGMFKIDPAGAVTKCSDGISRRFPQNMVMTYEGKLYYIWQGALEVVETNGKVFDAARGVGGVYDSRLAISPDQSFIYSVSPPSEPKGVLVSSWQITTDGTVGTSQHGFYQLEGDAYARGRGLCVDTNGWLYVATSLGIQVLDQAGRVNFIIPTPQQPHDVCFGGKDLSELFIACGDTIYKRKTKAHGYISGQMAPIKPAPPKL